MAEAAYVAARERVATLKRRRAEIEAEIKVASDTRREAKRAFKRASGGHRVPVWLFYELAKDGVELWDHCRYWGREVSRDDANKCMGGADCWFRANTDELDLFTLYTLTDLDKALAPISLCHACMDKCDLSEIFEEHACLDDGAADDDDDCWNEVWIEGAWLSARSRARIADYATHYWDADHLCTCDFDNDVEPKLSDEPVLCCPLCRCALVPYSPCSACGSRRIYLRAAGCLELGCGACDETAKRS